MTTDNRELREIDKELIDILFRKRRSQTVLQNIYTGCEVCERPLEEEYFEEHDLKRLIEENRPILDAIT